MPNFDKTALKKGSEAIREANEQRAQAGGDFKPFLHSIYWGDDGEERFVLFLNPIDEIPRVEFHPFIELDDGFPHQVMARTDPCIGERTDPIQDQWKYKPRLTNLAIAVELDPTFKTVNGRERPAGFEVKTREFERRIRDEKGELTDDREAVIAPCVGLISQSPYNFGNQLESFDNSEGPIHEIPLKIERLGKKENVTYRLVGYDQAPVDLTNLVDNIEFVSYLGDGLDDLLQEIDGLDNNEAALAIGAYLLNLKLEEFTDPEGYDELLAKITKPSRYGEKETKGKATRTAKPSQRRTRRAEAKAEAEPEAEEPEAKPVARRRKASESTSQETTAQERLEALRAKNAK